MKAPPYRNIEFGRIKGDLQYYVKKKSSLCVQVDDRARGE